MEKTRVDLTYLSNFSGGDQALIAEMMERFVVDAPEQLDVINKSIKKQDWKSTYKNLHNFKSSVNFIAIQGIKDLVLEMEKMAKEEKDLDQITVKEDFLNNECLLLVEEIKKELAK